MKHIIVYAILALSISLSAQTDLETKLFELPDVIFKEISTPEGYQAAYELDIKQPIDHKDPTKGFFYQRAFLSHKSFDAPTAIITNGYGRPSNRVTEVAKIAEAIKEDKIPLLLM